MVGKALLCERLVYVSSSILAQDISGRSTGTDLDVGRMMSEHGLWGQSATATVGGGVWQLVLA
jgi:hypothetical protein